MALDFIWKWTFLESVWAHNFDLDFGLSDINLQFERLFRLIDVVHFHSVMIL